MTDTQVQADVVHIQSWPFDAYLTEPAWAWLNEFPQNNFDDFGPKDLHAFRLDLAQRNVRHEKIWCAYVGVTPAGIIGYAPLNSYCGFFHGICFAKEWHGKGVARAAVSKAIDEIFAGSTQKISAAYFADNERVDSFLRKLGLDPDGCLARQTLRGGIPVDMQMRRLFKEDWLCRSSAS